MSEWFSFTTICHFIIFGKNCLCDLVHSSWVSVISYILKVRPEIAKGLRSWSLIVVITIPQQSNRPGITLRPCYQLQIVIKSCHISPGSQDHSRIAQGSPDVCRGCGRLWQGHDHHWLTTQALLRPCWGPVTTTIGPQSGLDRAWAQKILSSLKILVLLHDQPLTPRSSALP